MIAPDTIQQILSIARIEEVIGDFVSLKKRGVNYIGNCPFHEEKSPSFTVSAAKGIYKCFGCGKAGNVTKFVMEHELLTYPESLEWLAKKYNIAIANVQLSPKQIEEQKSREQLLSLNQLAKEYFVEQLWNSEEGKSIGMSYFKERQLSETVMKKFELGYNPDAEQAFTNYAQQKGFTLELLKSSGLTTQQRNADFFRARVIFPIHNVSGRVVAFGARTLRKDKTVAKYFNSPETEVYHKSKVLYGLYQARNPIAKNDFCYLVEGYMDVISLHQGGVENVAASSGTALTIDQIRLIKRYTQNIVLLYDGDAAGIKAALRGLELIVEEGLNLKIVLLPDGEDPDSYMHKHGAQGFNEFVLQNAKDFIRFKIQFSIEETKADPYRKAAVTKELITTFGKIPDGIVRNEYIKEFCSMLQLSEEMVVKEVNNVMRTELKKKTSIPLKDTSLLQQQATSNFEKINQPDFFSNPDAEQEKNIIRILLEWGDRIMSNGKLVAEYLAEEIELSLIDSKENAELFNLFLQEFENAKTFNPKNFINSANESVANISADLLKEQYQLSPNWEAKHQIFVKSREMNFEEDVNSSVHHFKLKKLLKLIQQNLQKIKTEKNLEEEIQLQYIHMQLSVMKADLAKASGTVIRK